MSQQYVLLRTESDLLNSLIGQSFNQKSKFEAEKILDEIHCKAESRMIGKKALCYIVDNLEIRGVGGSTLMKDRNGKIISNLILDQFGVFLAGIFRKNTGANTSVVLKDVSGVNKTVRMYGTTGSLFNDTASNIGSGLRVGSGSTPPARTDFKIETAFGTAPESLNFVIGSNPIFNTAQGFFKTAGTITAGGSGTINESIHELLLNALGVTIVFSMFRDIISPAQAFIAGQTISLEYTIQL